MDLFLKGMEGTTMSIAVEMNLNKFRAIQR